MFLTRDSSSRYEQWTSPEYYKQAEGNFQLMKETRAKGDLLEKKREKLKSLFEDEKLEHERELQSK